MRRSMQIIFPIVLVMALIGVVVNPLGLLRQLLFMTAIIAIIFFLYRLYISRRYGTSLFPKREGPTKAQLRKAKRTTTVQSSHLKRKSSLKGPNGRKASTRKPHSRSPLKTRREDHNLTVIEGKKNKKKSRAFF
ncbi:hypothetical protein [Bacillus solitudinis]|uniref:hypothetical protein n=1 Tax=Bacillus solitudinis TaxID=2014074 RepID=UPI000C241872|nr:hypothetical protein [Bacillus solitudinis]